MKSSDILKIMDSLATRDPKDLAGMARFGINVDKAWVISIPKLRNLAKEIKRAVPEEKARHALAQEVYQTDIHEGKILAALFDVPTLVTDVQMENWATKFDSWDVVDMVCGNLFDRTELAVKKAGDWAAREEEFIKRAGFVLMATLAVHNKNLTDDVFVDFLGLIEEHSGDDRNFVKKAVNWALRSISKSRNKNLYREALSLAEKLKESDNKTSRWVGGDAFRELSAEYIKKRFFG